MIINNEIIENHLQNKWNWYFGRGNIYKGLSHINDVPSDIYKDFLYFLKSTFKQDIMFDYLYRKYLDYVMDKYKKDKKNYLIERDFERHLLDLNLITYVTMDENYNQCKYVCYYNKLN